MIKYSSQASFLFIHVAFIICNLGISLNDSLLAGHALSEP
uniref:Uncharacterized protein n=1 Tax=Rhizophora mucronata TaxID=61149 RepID=A0A2P2PZ64_RHIMU